jgi:hypothetical protein
MHESVPEIPFIAGYLVFCRKTPEFLLKWYFTATLFLFRNIFSHYLDLRWGDEKEACPSVMDAMLKEYRSLYYYIPVSYFFEKILASQGI